MKKYVMALDQGTTSSRAILFDRQGAVVSTAQKEFTQIYPRPGWVEHDPMEIWASQLAVAREAQAMAGAKPEEIAAIGITNQRETTVVWDQASGQPIANAIVWQCRRTADRIGQLVEEGLADYVQETTGLIPDAYFSASKIEWILDQTPGARQRAAAGELLFGTIDSWLIWNLTGGRVHATDRTNASRTMLYDIGRGCWDDRLLSWFGIPKTMLPKVLPSGACYGLTDEEVFGGQIAIGSAVGDQQAALFGQCCFAPGDVKNTYGTGCFLLMNTGEQMARSKKGLLTTIAATADQTVQFALEGSVFAAGAAIQWLRDGLELITDPGETQSLALAVEDSKGVYVVPAFTGLGAPYWDPYARGTVVGLTRGTGKNHLVRATLESIAYQAADILAAMLEESGISLTALSVDGGVTKNRFLMQFQADIINLPVIRPANAEATALGAAFLAGLATGFWKDREQLKHLKKAADTFVPAMEEQERAKRLRGWHRAVDRAKGWEE